MRKNLLITFSFLSLSAAFGGNIVLNPGFETGDFTSWTVLNVGWGINGTSHTGNFAAVTGCANDPCINGTSGQIASISQVLTTTPSGIYTLSFWFNPGSSSTNFTGTIELEAFWGGTPVIDLVLVGTGGIAATPAILTPTTPGFGYNQYTVTGLVAGGSSTTLEFRGRQDPGNLFLDDISVNAGGSAPEPGTMLLGACGLLGLGLWKRRAARA